MWLYRVELWDEDGVKGLFFDASASIKKAIQAAKISQRRDPSKKAIVVAEQWADLSRLKYLWYRLTGTYDGFGVDFKSRHGYEITESKTVWPE